MTIHDDDFQLENGKSGTALAIKSANPDNYHQAMSRTASMPEMEIWGKLFLPEAPGPHPVVMVVPGSLGLAESHIAKAPPLLEAGIAVCLLDPFMTRSVTSTVDNQAQYSFAASAWDILAAAEHLARLDEIDESRIGAQGHSRGGSAVIMAATELFAKASPAPKLKAVYAAYPWCGQQFLDPAIGATRVRAVIGDLDEWCLPQQVQSQIHAMRLTGGDASMKLYHQAHHSYDRPTPLELVDNASVAPGAPTIFIDNDGAFIHPVEERADPDLTDRDLFLYAFSTGHGRTGAHIGGGEGGLADAFMEDMMHFWRSALLAS